MSAAHQNTTPILDDGDAAFRRLLLDQLQVALAELGIHSTLARRHRIVLRYTDGVAGPSGLTDPQLYVLAEPGSVTVTTDGTTYQLSHGQKLEAADPSAAAAIINLGLSPAAHIARDRDDERKNSPCQR
jgi:hypothetical protein